MRKVTTSKAEGPEAIKKVVRKNFSGLMMELQNSPDIKPELLKRALDTLTVTGIIMEAAITMMDEPATVDIGVLILQFINIYISEPAAIRFVSPAVVQALHDAMREYITQCGDELVQDGKRFTAPAPTSIQ